MSGATARLPASIEDLVQKDSFKVSDTFFREVGYVGRQLSPGCSDPKRPNNQLVVCRNSFS